MEARTIDVDNRWEDYCQVMYGSCRSHSNFIDSEVKGGGSGGKPPSKSRGGWGGEAPQLKKDLFWVQESFNSINIRHRASHDVVCS